MSDDDLGDFFNEINQIPVENDSVETVQANVAPPVVTTQVISRPAEINKELPTEDETAVPQQLEVTAVDPMYGGYNWSFNTVEEVRRVPPPQVPRQNKTFVRKAADETWVDNTLQEWPENDFRIFVGDLGKEVTTEMLAKKFNHYKSFAKAKVVRNKGDNKARGYGFVSMLDPMECAKALREMNGQYLGARPMKLSKSTWKDRDLGEVKTKEKKKRKLQESLGLV